MQLVRLAPTLVLSLAICGAVWAADAVSVDQLGNVAFSGAVTVSGQVAAPNVLQGSPGVSITSAVTLGATAFGNWHWITGTTENYTITLPSAVSNIGRVIGVRVKNAAVAPKTYTLAAISGELIDGMTTTDLTANATLVVMSDGIGWARVSGTPTSTTPSGFIAASASGVVPSGWLACNGQAVSRAVYASLFAAIGTTFGAGDGTTTFNLPDFRRRVLVGAGGTGTSVLGSVVGSKGGEESHALLSTEMPAHSHGLAAQVAGVTQGGDPPLATVSVLIGAGADVVTGTAGSSMGHNIMQPSLVAYYLIKY